MLTPRSTGTMLGSPATRETSAAAGRRRVWTGTALRFARRPLVMMLVIAVGPSGSARRVCGAETGGFTMTATPGAIGAWRQTQNGPCPDIPAEAHLQTVSIRGPAGMEVAIETAAGWTALAAAPVKATLVVGAAYRLRITGIPGAEGVELYPSVRVLARLATPPGLDRRFPVEIVLDESDLAAALGGAHVRRVVYVAFDNESRDINAADWFDVRPGDDARDVAATLGAPVAEVVIGNRLPSGGTAP
jgi:hypothetical protein